MRCDQIPPVFRRLAAFCGMSHIPRALTDSPPNTDSVPERGRPARDRVSAGRVPEDVPGAISTEPDCRRQRRDRRTRPERQPRRATRSRRAGGPRVRDRRLRRLPPSTALTLGQVHAATKGGRRLAPRPIQGRHDGVHTREGAEAKRASTGSAVTHRGCRSGRLPSWQPDRANLPPAGDCVVAQSHSRVVGGRTTDAIVRRP
jgi:hypothetical protein